MPTKIRLQRHGKKRSSFFHIVIADNRAPRDGKFIEKIGTYNPNTNPASINIEFEKALNWLKTGAQPTDTVRAILSYEGVMFKDHLDRGVLKGAFSQDDADKKFEIWKKEKLSKIQSKIDSLEKSKSESIKSKIKAEEEYSKKREQEILAKTSALAEEAHRAAATASAAETPVAEAEADATTAEVEVETKVEAEEVAEVSSETETPAEAASDVNAEASTEETSEENTEKSA